MLFNSGTNSLYADALFWSGANSASFPVDPDFTRSANNALDRILALILRADNTWEFNDANLSTELLDITTAIVSGTQTYAISTSWLKIKRVRVKDANGNWITLRPIDRDEASDSQLSETGTPYAYFKLGSYIYLVGTPTYSSTGGLEVQFQRGADYFVVGDTTKAPGFASQFHRLISLYAALDYVEANDIPNRDAKIRNRITAMEAELQQHYADRDRDDRPSLALRREDYGGEALGGGLSGSPRAFYF